MKVKTKDIRGTVKILDDIVVQYKELNFCKFLYKYKYKEECSFVIW